MSQVQFLNDLASWLANAVFWISAVFPLATAAFWPWWQSWWGRNIVGLEICIAAALLPSVLYRDFGTNDIALRWAQDVSLALVAVVIIWRAVMIWAGQRKGVLAARNGTGRHPG